MENIQSKTNKSQGIDLVKVSKQLWLNKWFILKVAGVAMFLGLIVAKSIPKEYTCTVKMAPEGNKTNISGDVSSLAAMTGLNLGANNDGINLNIYPDLVQSVPFLTELMSVQLKNQGNYSERTFYEYIDKGLKNPWWNTILSLPIKIVSIVRKEKSSSTDKKIDPYNLTKKQDANLEKLKSRMAFVIDKKTGIINASLTLQDRVLAAIIADTIVVKLQKYIINYKTGKAKLDLDFTAKMLDNAKVKYYNAQKRYANYVDENKNVVLESVRIEQERLNNEQQLTYNIYSNLAQQVEISKMKVQEQTPCVTVIEPARIPVKKSNTSGITILLGFIFIGIISGIAKVIFVNWKDIQLTK